MLISVWGNDHFCRVIILLGFEGLILLVCGDEGSGEHFSERVRCSQHGLCFRRAQKSDIPSSALICATSVASFFKVSIRVLV